MRTVTALALALVMTSTPPPDATARAGGSSAGPRDGAGAPVAAVAPPPARRDNFRETLFGVELTDPYRWLETQDAPATRAFIEAQEAHARSVLDALPDRATIAEKLAPYFLRDDVGVPWLRGGRLLFARRLKGEQLHSICVRDGFDGTDRVLVDPLAIEPGGTASVSLFAVSRDGSRAVIGVRRGGADETDLRILDVATGREIARALPSARYLSVAFDPRGDGLLVVRHDGGGPLLRRHRFNSAPENDEVLFGQGLGPGLGIGVQVTPDDRHLIATVWHGSAGTKSEIHARLASDDGPFTPIVDDIDARFGPDAAPGTLYVETTWNAPNGRVLAIDLDRPGREHWREVIPESEWALQDVTLAGGRICARYLENVRPVIRVFTPDGQLERTVQADGFGALSGPHGEWDQPVAFLASSSWLQPETIETLTVATGERATWHVEAAPLRSRGLVIEQHWFTSSDGARVPLFLARRENTKPTGDAAVLMVGYGGFALSKLPSFDPRVAAWLDLGGMVALPALRGGAEFGERWHEQAILDRKQQTFDDLFAAAAWLVDAGWTNPSRLALFGRSNGGLLVGAAITQRPELFRAVVCGYPLLDMVRYHRFLVARFWVPEYGSSEDEAQFRTLLAYSPYHRVKPGEKYPAVLLVTGDSDTRVDPLHARKMAALLQASTGSGRPVLLHYDTQMGHVGGLPADKEISDLADETAFLAWQLGLSASPSRRGRNPPRI